MQLDLTPEHSAVDLTQMNKLMKRKINLGCLEHFQEDLRTHLGASVIGADCMREVWYDWRWVGAEEIGGREYRLFNRGHLEEERNRQWLELAGCKILSEQEKIDFGFGGHGGGSSDKIILLPPEFNYSDPVLVEEKTHSDKNFKQVDKHGVQKAKPVHVKQANMYARRLGIKLILYFPVNKNDDDIKPEFLWADPNLADICFRKADEIIERQTPPMRPRGRTKTHHECVHFCNHHSTCWQGIGARLKNCRSCKFARPVENKQWHCDKHAGIIPADFIPKGCDDWEDITRE